MAAWTRLLIPSMRPLAILLWNQRRMPFQWRLTVRAASMIGGSRLWVAQRFPLLEEDRRRVRSGLVIEFLERQPDAVCTCGLEMA